jgi:hypothetical protein
MWGESRAARRSIGIVARIRSARPELDGFGDEVRQNLRGERAP